MGKSIDVERIIAADIGTVFDAWLDADSLGTWMCPGEMSGASAELGPRVGGGYRPVMHGSENDFVHTGQYLKIERPKLLVSAGSRSGFRPRNRRPALRCDSKRPQAARA